MSKRSRDASPALAPSKRSAIRSFKVMDVVHKADTLARSGRTVYHLEVGQPQSSAPKQAIATAQQQVSVPSGVTLTHLALPSYPYPQQLDVDRCGYTSARGEPPLRAALADHYKAAYGVDVSTNRIHLTPGSSGAFTIAFMAAFDVGDAVAVPSVCYPCYRNLLKTYGCEVISLDVDANYNVTAKELAAAQALALALSLAPSLTLSLTPALAVARTLTLTPTPTLALIATLDPSSHP